MAPRKKPVAKSPRKRVGPIPLSRVKIKIPEMFQDKADEELPWKFSLLGPTKLEHSLKGLVDFFNRDGDMTKAELENMKDTAKRVAKAWRETTMTITEIKKELKEIIKTSFPIDNSESGMVTQGPIVIHSYCPHHLLPVTYECFVAYVPKKGGNVVGLSKIARAAMILGKRPVLHESLVKDIADVFYKSKTLPFLPTAGSIVSLTGLHMCMTCRGIQSAALTTITEPRGSFWKGDMESKFNQSINNIRSSKL